MASGVGSAVAQVTSAVVPADSGWNGARATDIARRAVAARRHAYSDSSLRSFRAEVQGHVYFFGEFRDERELVRADQVALEVLWQAPDRAYQTIVGRRHEKRLPTNISYHIDHLSLVLDNFGDRIRLGEGQEVRDVPHPAGRGALEHYEYRLVDSLEIRIQDEVTRVYRLQVRPIDPSLPGVVGTLFVDRETGALARLAATFTGASYLDEDLDYISVDLKSGRWQGRFWLPVEQEVEIRREVSWLSFPVGGVIRTRLKVHEYRINEPGQVRLARGARVGTVPPEALAAFGDWRAPLFAGPISPGERTDESLDKLRERARELVSPGALLGTSPVQLHLPDASSGLRARRAEGLLIGGGIAFRPDEQTGLRFWAGYPFAREQPQLAAGVSRTAGPVDLSLDLFLDRFADIGPVPAAAGVISTLGHGFEGEDYTDPYFERGGAVEAALSAGAGRWSVGIAVASHRSANLAVDPRSAIGGTFRSVRPISEGTLTAVNAGLVQGVGQGVGATWTLDVRAELGLAGPGDFGFSRLLVGLEADGERPDTPWGWTVVGKGGVGGGTLPAQRLFLLGGRGTMPGYSFRAWGGDRMAYGAATVSREVLEPWLRVRLLGAWGTTGLSRAGEEAAAILGVTESGAGRFSAGAGLGIFYDIVRLDLVRGLRGGDWVLMLSLKRALWPVL